MAWLNYGYWSLVGNADWRTFRCTAADLVGLALAPASAKMASWNSASRKFWRQFFCVQLYLLDCTRNRRPADWSNLRSRFRRPLLASRRLAPSASSAVLVSDQCCIRSGACRVSRVTTERYRRVFLQVYEAIALISFLFGGLLLPLAYPLTFVLLGPKWVEAAPILAGFAILVISYPLIDACNWLFASQGRGRDWLMASLFVSILTVLAFVSGLPFGPAGVAFAYSATSVLAILPVAFHMAGRSGPVGAVDLYKGFVRHFPVWGIVCGTTYLVRAMIADRAPSIQLLICIPTGLLVGSAFIGLYSPARRTARILWDAFLVLKNTRTTEST